LTNHIDAHRQVVFEELSRLLGSANDELRSETPLLGGDSPIDSMRLVELCLILEDRAAELNCVFAWTSEEAMSRSRGMFRNAGALADEFARQIISQR
jgi:hypothetical protein